MVITLLEMSSARAHARAHARTRARTHTRTHAHTHTHIYIPQIPEAVTRQQDAEHVKNIQKQTRHIKLLQC